MPNLCYCCGRLNHGDKDRPLWIQSRGILKEDIKKQKKISSSLRAPPYLPSNQNVIFVLGYFNKLGSTGKEARRVEVATLTTMAKNREKASLEEENPAMEIDEFRGELNAEINVSNDSNSNELTPNKQPPQNKWLF